MTGDARYTALLDACVLYPMAMTDSLMSLAAAGLFAAKWTRRIEREWMFSLEQQRPDLKGRLDTRRDAMREAIPDWEVLEEAWEPHLIGLNLPDPNDRHVLAAAIAGQANCIVTCNQRDFPRDVVDRYGIEIVDPDVFIIHQWDIEPIASITAFRYMRARWKKPQALPKDFAEAMARGGLPQLAERLRGAAELI